MHSHVHCGITYISEDMERVYINRRIDKENVVYKYNRILISFNMNDLQLE